jgi:Zn-dependent peptidase ImmA (M78 family)
MGIEVIERPIRTANGLWIPDHNLIVIKSNMRAVHKRTTLAHELGHVCLGHRDDRPKHEVLADRFAAERLIDHDKLVELGEWIEHPAKLAAELGVTNRILRVYLNMSGLARTA